MFRQLFGHGNSKSDMISFVPRVLRRSLVWLSLFLSTIYAHILAGGAVRLAPLALLGILMALFIRFFSSHSWQGIRLLMSLTLFQALSHLFFDSSDHFTSKMLASHLVVLLIFFMIVQWYESIQYFIEKLFPQILIRIIIPNKWTSFFLFQEDLLNFESSSSFVIRGPPGRHCKAHT